MPGPPRTYANAADRQRAYRQRARQAAQDAQEEGQELSALAYALQDAVRAAAAAGDDVASAILHADPALTLRAAVELFHDLAETPEDKRPWLFS